MAATWSTDKAYVFNSTIFQIRKASDRYGSFSLLMHLILPRIPLMSPQHSSYVPVFCLYKPGVPRREGVLPGPHCGLAASCLHSTSKGRGGAAVQHRSSCFFLHAGAPANNPPAGTRRPERSARHDAGVAVASDLGRGRGVAVPARGRGAAHGGAVVAAAPAGAPLRAPRRAWAGLPLVPGQLHRAQPPHGGRLLPPRAAR